MLSVDMTSDVKGRKQLFYVRIRVFSFCLWKSRSQSNTMVDHAAIRGLAPTFRASVGCLPQSRDERTCRPRNAAEGATTPGLRLCRCTVETCCVTDRIVRDLLALPCAGDRCGHRPHEADPLPRHGHDHLVGMLPTRPQVAVPLTAPALGFPTDGWARFGVFLQAALERSAHFRWGPLRPGAVNENPTGLGLAGLGHGPLAAARATGVY
jgi:hypothetical protein